MPIFLDRHELPYATREEVAQAHMQDIQVQDRFGVRFLTYWFDDEHKSVFCLIESPDRESAVRAHEASHANVPTKIIEVDPSAVLSFLGRIQDPDSSSLNVAGQVDAAFRAIMFTDMVGSTEMTARLGDELAVELVRTHDGIVRSRLAEHGGREIKHLGDGIMAAFDDVTGAIGCARAIQRSFAEYNRDSHEPVQVRIGLHAGEPVEDSNDLFGTAVQLASRLCDAAAPGQIMLSEDVRAASRPGQDFRPLGVRDLKGFVEPVPVLECRW